MFPKLLCFKLCFLVLLNVYWIVLLYICKIIVYSFLNCAALKINSTSQRLLTIQIAKYYIHQLCSNFWSVKPYFEHKYLPGHTNF